MNNYISIQEAVKILNVSDKTIRRKLIKKQEDFNQELILKNKLPLIKIKEVGNLKIYMILESFCLNKDIQKAIQSYKSFSVKEILSYMNLELSKSMDNPLVESLENKKLSSNLMSEKQLLTNNLDNLNKSFNSISERPIDIDSFHKNKVDQIELTNNLDNTIYLDNLVKSTYDKILEEKDTRIKGLEEDKINLSKDKDQLTNHINSLSEANLSLIKQNENSQKLLASLQIERQTLAIESLPKEKEPAPKKEEKPVKKEASSLTFWIMIIAVGTILLLIAYAVYMGYLFQQID